MDYIVTQMLSLGMLGYVVAHKSFNSPRERSFINRFFGIIARARISRFSGESRTSTTASAQLALSLVISSDWNAAAAALNHQDSLGDQLLAQFLAMLTTLAEQVFPGLHTIFTMNAFDSIFLDARRGPQ
jgi:hypothetical protein